MVITLLVAAACAILASRRGRSWWKWGLGAAGIDIGVAVLLMLAASKLGINVRRPGIGTVAAWIVLIVPHVAAIVVVGVSTRRATPSSNSVGARSPRSHRQTV